MIAFSLAMAAGVLVMGSARDARGDDTLTLRGTPFESGANAAAVPRLAGGAIVRRTSFEGTLTADDALQLGALGLRHAQATGILLRKIRRTEGPRQLGRLRAIVHALELFGPSEACDAIVRTGDSSALCTSHVDGPLGSVALRLPLAARMSEGAAGMVRLVLSNPRPMEAKPFFGWSEVVAPGHLKVLYDMYPADDGWLVYVRVGIEMSAHEDASEKLSAAVFKLESWLAHELERS